MSTAPEYQVDHPIMLYVAFLLAAHTYLIGVIAGGIAWGNRGATALGLAAAGTAYLCYLAQLSNQWTVASYLVPVSIALGALAGLALVVW